MSSGHKRDIANTRERLHSADRNRAQAFAAAERSDLARWLMDIAPSPVGVKFYDYGAAMLIGELPPDADPGAIGTPLRADVFDGLVVTPIVGTTSLHVSPGLIGVHDPDGQVGSSQATPPSADDSSYKIVSDTGIQTNGVLVIAANAGPGARVDVIECRRVEAVTETAVRDVFDPATGTSAPQTLDKVSAAQLEYRVRQGVAGNGFPGNVQGWLPLAVAYIAAGAGATTNDVDFWDVRPLVKDRLLQPFRSHFYMPPPLGQQWLYADEVTVGGQCRVGGTAWGEIGGVRCGGNITTGIPGADTDYVNALSASWQEPGFVPVNQAIWYLYLIFPYGLPRWVRYNRTAIGGLRFPFGMRGIPLVSSTPTIDQGQHQPSGVLKIPAFLDPLAASNTTDACCILAGTQDGAGPAGCTTDGSYTALSVQPPTQAPSFSAAAYDEYQLVAGTHFPHDARMVRVTLYATFTGVAGNNLYLSNFEVQLYAPGTTTLGPGNACGRTRQTYQFDGAASINLSFTVDIPRYHPAYAADPDLYFKVNWNPVGGTKAGPLLAEVTGWKTAD